MRGQTLCAAFSCIDYPHTRVRVMCMASSFPGSPRRRLLVRTRPRAARPSVSWVEDLMLVKFMQSATSLSPNLWRKSRVLTGSNLATFLVASCPGKAEEPVSYLACEPSTIAQRF